MVRIMLLMAVSLVCGAAQAQQTFDKIKGRGNVVVGYREDGAPFSYLDAAKKPVGYSLEFCDAVAARLLAQPGMTKLKSNYKAVPADRILQYVAEGSIDMVCSGTSDTEERRKQVAFSKPIYFDGIAVMVRKKDNITKLDQLKGKKLVLIKSTTAATLVENYLKKNAVALKVEEVGNAEMAMSQIQLGWSAGYARDRTLLAMQRAALPAADDYAILPERLSSESIAIVFRRDDPAMKALVDGVIDEMVASGKAQALYEKWFLKPIPVGAASKSLDIPMSEELKAAFARKK